MAAFKFLGADTGKLPHIDRYELVAEIASGGMATVFLGRMLGVGGFERFVAIKRLHPHLGSDESFVKMFLDEARLVANIRHQHVVPVLEVGAGEAGYYLAMEYIEGDTLATILSKLVQRGAKLPSKVAVRIVLDMLAGLHAAHELVDPNGEPVGLVHRDVSPQNVLLDVHGVTRIADFGVAHATSRLGSTVAGQLKGKVAYMAPEQARGTPVTRRADIFAAGIVLWEALCMKRLFMADNEAVTLNKLMFEPIPKLRAGNPTMPSSVEKVIDRALNRDPEARFATAAEFSAALEEAARGARMLGDTHDTQVFLADLLGAATEERRAAIRAHLAFIEQASHELQDIDVVQEPSPAPHTRPAPPVVTPPGSSVSSAVMTLSAEPPSQPSVVSFPALQPTSLRAPPEPVALARSPSAVIAWSITAGLLGLVAAAGLVVALTRGDSAKNNLGSATIAADGSASSPQPEDASADRSDTSAAVTVDSAHISADAGAADSSARLGAGGPKPGGKTRESPPVGVPAPTAGAAPADTDDLKKNPYRAP